MSPPQTSGPKPKGFPSRGKGRGGGGSGRGGRGPKSNNRGAAPATNTSQQSRQRLMSEHGDDGCAVCLNRIQIFAVGMCNHPVCSECSTRMRVLAEQNECPICRQDMPKVIHTEARSDYNDVCNNPYRMDRKFRVCFENDGVEDAFRALLEHRCRICHENSEDEEIDPRDVTFKTFKQLDTHTKRKHELFFCDLCSDNLTIFSHERRCYNRHDLAVHRRKGDPDDTSHKGHPLCEFCETRFVDKDELYRHLRRDHYFCHFCDADGIQHFYPDYEVLKDHFRQDHFLCEDGACLNGRFTHAFRSEIDLKAHKLDIHAGNISKAEAKRNRVVGLEINYARPSNDQARRRRGLEPDGMVDQIDGPVSRPDQPSVAAPDYSADNFPSLSGGANATNHLARAQQAGQKQKWSDGRRLPQNEEDFPSLPGAAPAVRPASAFPTGRPRPQTAKAATNRPKSKEEEFPTLGGPSKGLAAFRPATAAPAYRQIQTPAWNEGESNAPRGRMSKVAPAPEISSEDDSKKPKPAFGTMTTLTKKEKKPVVSSDQEFPGLGPAKAPILLQEENRENEASTTEKKGKKKKKKHFLLDDEDAGKNAASAAKGTPVSLQSAADLIFKEKPAAKTEDDSWTQVEVKPKPTPAERVQQKQEQNGAIPGLSARPSQTKAPPPGLGAASAGSNSVMKKASTPEEDFPSLGASSKKLPAQFRPQSTTIAAPMSGSAAASLITTKPSGGAKPKEFPQKKPQAADFPSLGSSAARMSANFRPTSAPSSGNNGWSSSSSSSSKKAPPGFASNTNGGKPPPGFQKKLQNARYQQPKDFSDRNSKLVTTLTGLMGGKSLEFSQFKKLSSGFRSGSVDCAEYHAQCMALLEEDKFAKIFPELICLLPDIEKQKELLSIHSSKFASHSSRFYTCPICDQVLAPADAKAHRETHNMDADFPML